MINIGCPSGWKGFENHCYKFFNALLSWWTARDFCNARNANLLSINSQRETAFITENLMKNLTSNLWTGGYKSYSTSSKLWAWQDNATYNFHDWYESEPNDSDNSDSPACVYMAHWYDYKWFDTSCSNIFSFVCKIWIINQM